MFIVAQGVSCSIKRIASWRPKYIIVFLGGQARPGVAVGSR
ncbi:hypothetical protein [Microterricola gilva]|nr:hypothetical protein [Microterricola gilva]